MNTQPRVLCIGCGNMGAAILRGIINQYPEARVVAVDPSVERARALLPSSDFVRVISDVESLQGFRPDITLLAIKPQQLLELASTAGLMAALDAGVTVSILAGVPLAHVKQTLQCRRVVRVMPNLAALVSQGMTVAYGRDDLKQEDVALVQTLFEATGQFAWLEDEALMDPCTAVVGSGPGYLFAFAQHLEAAAVDSGLSPQLARRAVAQMLLGASTLLLQDERSAEELKHAVSSRGGTTQAGLAVLEAEGALPALLAATVRSASLRASQLSNG